MHVMGKPYNGHALVDSRQHSAAQAQCMFVGFIVSNFINFIAH